MHICNFSQRKIAIYCIFLISAHHTGSHECGAQILKSETQSVIFLLIGDPDANQAKGCLWWGERRQWCALFRLAKSAKHHLPNASINALHRLVVISRWGGFNKNRVGVLEVTKKSDRSCSFYSIPISFLIPR